MPSQMLQRYGQPVRDFLKSAVTENENNYLLTELFAGKIIIWLNNFKQLSMDKESY